MDFNGEVVDYSPITFFINCNDLFFWACSDCEEIESDAEVADIRLAYDDCSKLHEYGNIYAPLLWVARKRKMRPQDPYYTEFPKELHGLFNDCGPERSKESQG